MSKEFKLKRDEILDHCKYGGNELVEHLVIEALLAVFSHDELGKFLDGVGWNNREKDEFECYLVFEGKKVPIQTVCKHWQSQMDELIKRKAIELLKDKLRRVSDAVCTMEKLVIEKAAQELGVTISEEDL